MKFKLLLLSGSLLLGALGLEGILRLRPQLLPMGYRAGFPMRGIEFLRPGLLSEMPVDELWPPLVSAVRVGAPPADLKQYGVAPLDVDLDARRYPHSRLPVDALGLPNAILPGQADVVFVGDSMMMAASTSSPAGLVSRFAEQSGLSAYSLGVPGLGPQHEASLLEQAGLPLMPKLVLWFFFGGNDLNDAKQVQQQVATASTRAELESYRSLPVSYLGGLLAWTLAGSKAPSSELKKPPLAALKLPNPEGEPTPLWLHPSYLARTALTRAQWEAHVAWEVSTQAILRSHALAEAQGAHFVFVYLPSKSEALLPALAEQKELLWRALNFDLEQDLSISQEQAVEQMLANRGALGQALGAFCAREGIPFFSATGVLERQALAGEAGYFSTDTHWTPIGQGAVLEALLSFLGSNGLLAH